MKFGVQFSYAIEKQNVTFGADPDPDPDFATGSGSPPKANSFFLVAYQSHTPNLMQICAIVLE